jgi:putative addiction module component (TIGR02574 family)
VAAKTKSPTKADILEMAKQLPWDQRWELLMGLKATFTSPSPPTGMASEDFRAELNRRWEECEAGRMAAAPYEDVIERLRRKNRSDG